MWRSLETEERRAFSESFYPFRAEPHKLSIFRQYAIKFAKKMLFNLIIKKKDNGNPIDSSIVVPVREVA
jgi:hypothetical protein